jgi:hypothetical protein
MALLDIFKRGAKSAGKNLENYIGGLLGEDLSQLSEEERKQIRKQGMSAVFDAMARGTTATQGLAGVAQLAGARIEQKRLQGRQKAAEDEMGRITGRLFGGAPAAPADMGEDETGLGTVAIQSQYRQNPQEALARMYGTSAGRDVAQMAPGLLELAQEGVKGRTVGGAVYNPLTGQFTKPPEEAQPKVPVREVDVGNAVIVYYNDGTSERMSKGIAPSAAGRGGMPDLSRDERDRIYKARDTINSSVETISGLQAARKLSDVAFEGPLANARATAIAALPDRFESAGAKETLEFDMVLQSQILPQLKVIFGGNPTEGERKILLDLQGSSKLPRAVRNRLIDDAIDKAQKRIQYNQEEVESILGGTYFRTTERGGPSMPKVPTPATSPKVDYIFRNGKLVKAE